MLALFAGSQKTPAKMDGSLFVSFDNDAKNIFVVEKKLQAELFMIDLIGLSLWEFCNFSGIGYGYPCVGGSFEGNLLNGP
jgi:hypothetical protein